MEFLEVHLVIVKIVNYCIFGKLSDIKVQEDPREQRWHGPWRHSAVLHQADTPGINISYITF